MLGALSSLLIGSYRERIEDRVAPRAMLSPT